MKLYNIWMFLSVSIFNVSALPTHSPTSIDPRHGNRETFLDIVIEEFKNENWDDDEAICHRQTLDVLNNARNLTLWATRIWDSIQSPVGVLYGSQYQLGNFDQCLQMPAHPQLLTQYCIADISVSRDRPSEHSSYSDPYGSVTPYINTLTLARRKLNTISWGVCIPASCKRKSIAKFSRILFSKSWLEAITPTPDITIDSCQVAGRDNSYSTGYYSFMYLLCLLFIIAVFSTYYIGNTPSSYIVSKIVGAFNIERNRRDLMKENEDEIPILNSLKVISAFIIVFIHTISFSIPGPYGNAMDLEKTLLSMTILLHIDVAVDTFFMMSGLLLVKGFMSRWDNPENLFVAMWKRYIRLIGPLALGVIGQAVVLGQMGSGPLWPRLALKEQDFCSRNWWTALTMISNFWRSEEMCLGHAWYIACDYQLVIAGTVLLRLFRRRRRAGLVAFAAAAVLSVLLPAWITYQNELPALPLLDIQSISDIRNYSRNLFMKLRYIKPQHRMGSYLVGMATGYLMSVYKSAKYQGRISKKLSLFGFIIAFAMGFTVLFVGGTFNTRSYDALEAALFAATNRSVWALTISVIVVISTYGHLPDLVKKTLNAGVWLPLSRLSYAVYLVHPLVISRTLHASRTLQEFDLYSAVINLLGVTAFSFLTSLMIWMLIEKPLVNLNNLMLYSGKTRLNLKPHENGSSNHHNDLITTEQGTTKKQA